MSVREMESMDEKANFTEKMHCGFSSPKDIIDAKVSYIIKGILLNITHATYLKYFLSLILSALFLLPALAQNEINIEEYRKIYNQLNQKIQTLEAQAQYDGEDQIVRQRLNLPPKLPAFDKWLRENVNIAPANNQLLNTEKTDSKDSKAVTQNQSGEVSKTIERQVQLANPQSSTQGNASNDVNSSSDESKATVQNEGGEVTKTLERQLQVANPQSGMQDNEARKVNLSNFSSNAYGFYAAGAIFLLMFFVNFVLYSRSPSLRKITIAPPFDLGVTGKRTDAENSVKWKRYIVEITLLVILGWFLLSVLPALATMNIGQAIAVSIFFFLVSQFGYIVIRYWIGFSSKCIKCNNPFAAKFLDSHTEPRSTFEKRSGRMVYTMETGLAVREFICRTCGHTWQIKKSYQKQIGSHVI